MDDMDVLWMCGEQNEDDVDALWMRVRGCLLSPTLFNIFLERVLCEALDYHEGSVSIGGRLIANFRFPFGCFVDVRWPKCG